MRVEGVDRVGDADAHAPAERRQAFDRDGIAGLRGGDGVGAGDRSARGEHATERGVGLRLRGLACQTVEHVSGGKRLQRSRLWKAGRLRDALVDRDQRVAELARRAGRTAIGASVDHDATADAGADREHHQAAHVEPAVGVVGLGERRDRGIVVDEHRQAEAVAELPAQRDVLQRDVDA